jgi:hypothetical protein
VLGTTCEELNSGLKDGRIVLLDVRPEEEYQAGYVADTLPGAEATSEAGAYLANTEGRSTAGVEGDGKNSPSTSCSF